MKAHTINEHTTEKENSPVCLPELLLSRLPPIRRMRGWRLYAVNGKKLLSLWSDYGRNIFGYKPRGLATIAKSAIDRGLVAPSPGEWNGRIARIIRKNMPQTPFVTLFNSPEEATRIATGGTAKPAPGTCVFAFDAYLKKSDMTSEPDSVSIILPVPAAFSIGILARKSPSTEREKESGLIDGLRGMTAIHALSLMFGQDTIDLSEQWKRIDRFSGSLFERSGPWLYPRYPRAMHETIFMRCMERGILISPDYDFPSSVPGDFDIGEMKPMLEIAEMVLSGE
jgi:hypothetical protein